MKRIWKYKLEAQEVTVISVPRGAEILGVQMQGDGPYVYALVDPEERKEDRPITVVGTGQSFTPRGRYVGSVQMDNNPFGKLVWHVFEGS